MREQSYETLRRAYEAKLADIEARIGEHWDGRPQSARCHAPARQTRVLHRRRPRRIPIRLLLDAAAGILLRGGLVAFATETVYGLGAIATEPEAVARIFAAKGRPAINPLIVHVAGNRAGPRMHGRMARAGGVLWPGDSGPARSHSSSPRPRSSPTWSPPGEKPSPFALPPGKVALGLIERSGKPIAAPSANRSNRHLADPGRACPGRSRRRIDLIIDSGPTTIGLESTVLDLTTVAAAAPPPRTDLGEGAGGSARRPAGPVERSAGDVGRAAVEPRADAGPLRARTPAFRVEHGRASCRTPIVGERRRHRARASRRHLPDSP